jgi:hypothetical protein
MSSAYYILFCLYVDLFNKEKITSLLESKVYEILCRYPTSKIEKKIQKLLIKHKTVLHAAFKRKLTPCHSKPPHLHGLTKIQKPDIPLRPIVSTIDSPSYALAEFLHESPQDGSTGSFMTDSEHFIKSIQDSNLQNENYLKF